MVFQGLAFGIALASCSFNNLSENPPQDSLAEIGAELLPSLCLTEIADSDSGYRSARFALRAYGDQGTDVPDGKILQEGYACFRARGQSSQGFPKKSMSLELRDPGNLDKSKNLALAGFPLENDFVLHSAYSDRSLVRNVFAYRLAAKVQDWAPRCKFIELWGNQPDGDYGTGYQGLYVLMEKVKVDKSRVNIKPLSRLDTEEDSLSGGYLMRIDWSSGSDWYPGTKTRNLAVVEPNAANVSDAQRAWLTDYLEGLEACLRSTPVGDWRAYLDQDSFIDFLLLNEICLNVDGYRLSTYMHKDRGGKIVAGPVWDFDLGMGNDWRSVDSDYWEIISQLQPDFIDQYPAFWWCELLHDADFRQALRARWSQLRSGIFSDSALMDIIDAAVAEALPAIERNYERWPGLTINDDYWWTPMPIPDLPGEGNPGYVDPAQYSYQDHLGYFKRWVKNRVAWMDSQAAWDALNAFGQDGATLHLDQDGNL